jgi:hypothetical protein
MASQRHHEFNPDEASSAGAGGRRNDNVVNFILQTYLASHDLDESALMLLKAAILALFNG